MARSVDWNSSGTKLASAALDRTVKIWSLEGPGQGREILNLGGHNKAVERVRWHPNNDSILCTASEDQTVRLWDIRLAASGGQTGTTSSSSPAIGGAVPSFSSSSSSSSSFGHRNCCVGKIHLVASSKYGYGPASVEWHPNNGSTLAVAEKDDVVRVYDVRKLTLPSSSSLSSSSDQHHVGGSGAVAGGTATTTASNSGGSNTGGGGAVGSGGGGGSLGVSSGDGTGGGGGGGSSTSTVPTKTSSSSSSRHHHHHHHSSSSSSYYLNVGRPVSTYSFRPDFIQECHFSPRGEHLVAATRDGTNGTGKIRILPYTNNKTREDYSLVGHTGPIYCLRFSPCGFYMATGGADALVGIWDVNEMMCLYTINTKQKLIRSVAFSHDSNYVACSSEEPTIDITNVQTGEHIGEINARYGADEMSWNPRIYALAFASGEGGGIIGGAGAAAVDVVGGGAIGGAGGSSLDAPLSLPTGMGMRGDVGGTTRMQSPSGTAHVTVVKLAMAYG